jgi:hypothetical protein
MTKAQEMRREMRLIRRVLTIAILLGGAGEAMAVVPAKAVTETVEFLVKHYGDDMLREGTETVGEQLTKMAAKYGDEGLDAVRKVGPRGIKVIQEAGENGLDAVKLINRYGDDAVWVISKPKGMAIFVKYGDDGARALIKHKGIADDVIEAHGKKAVDALNNVGAQRGRQIAMLQADGVLPAGSQGDELLDVVVRYGDKGMDFIWRNKGALSVTAVLGTFLANPEAYINGGVELARAPLDAMARNTNWTVLGLAGLAVFSGWLAWRTWLRRPGAQSSYAGEVGAPHRDRC